MRAWIEVYNGVLKSYDKDVALYMRAWIEVTISIPMYWLSDASPST